MCAAGKVEDLGTGEYRARFEATAAGTHSVWVQHREHNIAGSPFTAEVAHTAIAADCSYVVQEGLERGVSGSQVHMFTRVQIIVSEGFISGTCHLLTMDARLVQAVLAICSYYGRKACAGCTLQGTNMLASIQGACLVLAETHLSWHAAGYMQKENFHVTPC